MTSASHHHLPAISWSMVVARRMERHAFLARSVDAPVAAIAGAMCGAHAQIMPAAELSIGMRANGVTRNDVRNALWVERSLVKTYGPRGTVHLLPARDLPMWTGALSSVPTANAFPEKVRMTPGQTEAVVEAIGQALNGVEMTIDELSEAVVSATGPWAGDPVMPAFGQMWPRWRQAIGTAANRGVLCFSLNRGRMATYTNPHTWLPGFSPEASQVAVRELVRRYLYAYGPANPAYFAKWLAAPMGWAKRLFESMATELEPVNLEGRQCWVVAGDTAFPDGMPPTVCLLPYFDPFVVGGQPRELLYPGPAGERALNRGQAGNYPVLLVDGVVAGVWHQRRTGKSIDITVEPLEKLSAVQREELEQEARRVGEILDGRPVLSIGPVSVGPHA